MVYWQRASKKLVSDGALLPEIGPDNLNRNLTKYIWNGKENLQLSDLWEYLNRYTYLPRLKGRETLVKAVQSAVSGMLPGPFGYAERFDEANGKYIGLLIENSSTATIMIDDASVIVDPKWLKLIALSTVVPLEPGGPTPPGPGPTQPGTQPVRLKRPYKISGHCLLICGSSCAGYGPSCGSYYRTAFNNAWCGCYTETRD